MRDTLTSHNHRDFAQRYGGTYGWYLGDNKRILVQVRTVGERRVTFMDKNGAEYFSNADSGVQFEFIPVNRGFFNGPHETYQLTRVPQRQWHRGINGDNTHASVVSVKRYKTHFFTPVNVDFDVLHDIFDNQISVEQAFNHFDTKQRSAFAMSKHFAIGGGSVLFHREYIGSYVNRKISLDTELVEQEINDAVHRNNLPIEVEVKNVRT